MPKHGQPARSGDCGIERLHDIPAFFMPEGAVHGVGVDDEGEDVVND